MKILVDPSGFFNITDINFSLYDRMSHRSQFTFAGRNFEVWNGYTLLGKTTKKSYRQPNQFFPGYNDFFVFIHYFEFLDEWK